LKKYKLEDLLKSPPEGNCSREDSEEIPEDDFFEIDDSV
jgi:hypothetical protein